MQSRPKKIILIGETHTTPNGARILSQVLNYLRTTGEKINIALETSQFDHTLKLETQIATLLDPLKFLESKDDLLSIFKKQVLLGLLNIKDEAILLKNVKERKEIILQFLKNSESFGVDISTQLHAFYASQGKLPSDTDSIREIYMARKLVEKFESKMNSADTTLLFIGAKHLAGIRKNLVDKHKINEKDILCVLSEDCFLFLKEKFPNLNEAENKLLHSSKIHDMNPTVIQEKIKNFIEFPISQDHKNHRDNVSLIQQSELDELKHSKLSDPSAPQFLPFLISFCNQALVNSLFLFDILLSSNTVPGKSKSLMKSDLLSSETNSKNNSTKNPLSLFPLYKEACRKQDFVFGSRKDDEDNAMSPSVTRLIA
jgi:hypothetical protein